MKVEFSVKIGKSIDLKAYERYVNRIDNKRILDTNVLQ